MTGDVGGDPACWAHLFDDDDDASPAPAESLVVDLGTDASGSGGAIWSLPHRGDLDANLVRLDAGGVIGAHVNDEVDVLLFVQSGTGTLSINGAVHALGADHVALIPKGDLREIGGGADGITYLSVHRRRGSLSIGSRAATDRADG